MISVQGLWKEFHARPVLHGLDLEVGAGERIALVGPNGSGKTTLLRCLLGLLSYRGRISIFGNAPVRDHVATQRAMAYVPQRAPALPVPVRDLVRFWEAVGDLKWAVICIAQAKTYLDGGVRSVELASIGRRTAEAEWDLLQLVD